MTAKISLAEKFGLFAEHWQPKIIAAANGQEVKIVKVEGEFPWHHHDDAEEFFLVWKGRFRVEFRDHVVDMAPGECVVVPRGVEHRTCADEGRDHPHRTGRRGEHRQRPGCCVHRTARGGDLIRLCPAAFRSLRRRFERGGRFERGLGDVLDLLGPDEA
ncbi:MAG TPA: cupin domain-containing protein [Stellaceae bacterium]|nr:cupin domain-containing protein [Stellaceae bacterium]